MTVTLSLGANIGAKKENLLKAYDLITQLVGDIILQSDFFEYEPWGFDSDDNFLNSVIIVDTLLPKETLLNTLWVIEKSFGKEILDINTLIKKYVKRKELYDKGSADSYLSRVMDIDIIYYGEEIYSSMTLDIPHPMMHRRLFVLEPLASITPDFIHPKLGVSNAELLRRCREEE